MSQNTHIINVKTRGAKKSEKEVKGVSGALGGLAKKAGIAAAAYFGARGLINGVKGSIDAFAKQELAQKKLESALGKTSHALLSQARALQQVSMFGDEVIIEAQALIGSFVKEEDAIKAATKATLDLAAAKGMELTVAADLVSKTLGSSTNALSRYGIEVTGAVGSTERLESLTGNLAKVFGGQATQQAQTLTGKLEQMKNAMGDTAEDLGELMAPALGKVAGFLKTAAENVSGFIRGFTDTPLDTTIQQLEDLGVAGEGLLRLKNLQIDRDLKVVNLELKDMATGYESIEDLSNKSNDLTKEAGDLALELADINQNLSKEDRAAKEEELRLLKTRMIAAGGSSDELIEMQIAGMKRRQEKEKELETELGITQQNRINAIEKELSLLPDIGVKLHERNKLEAQRVQITEKLNKVEDKGTKDKIKNETMLAKIKKQTTVEGAKAEYFSALSGSKAHLIKQIMKHIAFPLNLVLAEGAGKSIDKLFAANNIQGAQYGADFITDGPQMMLVGEGSGPERVQVTPLVDENIDGPQGGGVNLTFNNPIMTDDFVEDVLVDKISEAIRLGGNLGVN